MPLNDSSSLSVSRGHRRLESDPVRSVVWVRGEHDLSTRVHLADTIAQAARLDDDADVVVDLSGVTFMDASTIGALVVARNRLRARSRSLSVRAPSPQTRRLLELCGLARLIDDRSAPTRPPATTALGSWVEVPAGDRGPNAAEPPAQEAGPSQEPAHAKAERRVELAGSVRQRRPPA